MEMKELKISFWDQIFIYHMIIIIYIYSQK